MSCWHKTTLLRIPVSALGFTYLKQWQDFVRKHEDEFQWEEGSFCESMSDDYPSVLNWGSIEFLTLNGSWISAIPNTRMSSRAHSSITILRTSIR